jgi:hypothetical protein
MLKKTSLLKKTYATQQATLKETPKKPLKKTPKNHFHNLKTRPTKP